MEYSRFDIRILCRVLLRHTVFPFLFFLSFISFSIQATEPGVTAGEFSVDSSGGANYSVPIVVPPGTAGMQPSLSLSYNSRSGNGLMGVGFSLGGLSVITRCPANRVVDGFIDGVDFDANDRFCIDGQRLISVSGVYGAEGTEYRTEIESFTKVISYGDTGNGPEKFKAWTKSGQVMEYGYTNDSRIEAQGKTDVRLWAVNKISDTVGNYLKVTYSEDGTNGTYKPTEINYTGNSSNLSPYAKVKFEYETRTDITPMYFAGSLIKNTERLTNIKTYTDNDYTTPVRDYQLTYDNNGAASRSRITHLTECDGSTTQKCFKPIEITWEQNPADGSFVENYVGTDIEQSGWNSTYDRYYQDVNGDGLTDFIMSHNEEGLVYVFLGEGDGSFVENYVGTDIEQSGWNSTYDRYFRDVNGDGLIDYILSHNDEGYVYVFLGEGDGSFVESYVGTDVEQSGWNSTYDRYYQDMNGDGLTDFIMSHNEEGLVYVFLGEGDGSFVENYVGTDIEQSGWNSTYDRYYQDVNGDGLTDFIMSHNEEGLVYVFLGEGDGSFVENYVGTDIEQSGWNSTYDRYFRDVNGDGLIDYILSHNDEGYVYVFLGEGDGSFVESYVGTDVEQSGWNSTYDRYYQDVNGDGLTDFIMSHNEEGLVYVFLGEGDGSFVENYVGTDIEQSGWNSTYDRYYQDVNGDGLTDFIMSHNEEGLAYVFLADGNISDQATSITDSLGISISISYKSLTDSNIYTKGSGSVYPEVDIIGSVYVVSSVKNDANYLAGGLIVPHQSETTYQYSIAKSSYFRGFLGFQTMTSTNVDTNIITTTTYEQAYPYVGMVKETKQEYDGAPLSKVITAFANKKTQDGVETIKTSSTLPLYDPHPGVLFPYASSVTKTDYELD